MKTAFVTFQKSEYTAVLKALEELSVTNFQDSDAIKVLKNKLMANNSVLLDTVPEKVVSLNKRVTIKADFLWQKQIQIVLPKFEDVYKNKYSICSTLGSTLFGYTEGDKIIWETDNFRETIEIVEVKLA